MFRITAMKQKAHLRLLAWCLLPAILLLPVAGSAEPEKLRVEPPNWWTGFKETSLQLMVHGLA